MQLWAWMAGRRYAAGSLCLGCSAHKVIWAECWNAGVLGVAQTACAHFPFPASLGWSVKPSHLGYESLLGRHLYAAGPLQTLPTTDVQFTFVGDVHKEGGRLEFDPAPAGWKPWQPVKVGFQFD